MTRLMWSAIGLDALYRDGFRALQHWLSMFTKALPIFADLLMCTESLLALTTTPLEYVHAILMPNTTVAVSKYYNASIVSKAHSLPVRLQNSYCLCYH